MVFKELREVIRDDEPVCIIQNDVIYSNRCISKLENNYDNANIRYIQHGTVYLEDSEDYLKGIIVYLDF